MLLNMQYPKRLRKQHPRTCRDRAGCLQVPCTRQSDRKCDYVVFDIRLLRADLVQSGLYLRMCSGRNARRLCRYAYAMQSRLGISDCDDSRHFALRSDVSHCSKAVPI